MGRKLTVLMVFWSLGVGQSYSQTANVCGSLIRQYEVAHGIPHKLLTAISLVESGRNVQGTVVAWPWTINANGKPYVFTSKNAAMAKVRALQRGGITSIDVGCMQVNLKQHPKAFSTLSAAFDPATNIAYAAKFLKTKKDNKGSWVNAIAHYHSSTAKFHVPYKAKVLKTWAKVQKGRMTLRTSTAAQESSVDKFMNDVEMHRGEFIETIATPGGRRIPMVVRFAPYNGFKGVPQGDSFKGSGSGPQIIRVNHSPKATGKLIINKMDTDSGQNQVIIQSIDVPYKIIRVNGFGKKVVSKTKKKPAVIAKFRAKSR